MPIYRLTFRPACYPRALLLLDVEADTIELDELFVTLWRAERVAAWRRTVVAWRARRVDLAGVDEACGIMRAVAEHRPAVPVAMKRQLIEQAGGKCANPGCPNRLVELHHIREWHIYRSHDAEHMIAICPACHDAIDRGDLRISDDELYRWKQIDRTQAKPTAHIFVEPGEDAPRLLLGSLAVEGASGVVVFDLSEHHRLSFAVRDREILLLNLKLSSAEGELLLDVVDGYVRACAENIELSRRPGYVEVPAGLNSKYVPVWARELLLKADEQRMIGRLPLLSLQVIDRGLLRVRGLWLHDDRGMAVTHDALLWLTRHPPRAVAMAGSGESSVIHYAGPLSTALFGFS